MKICLYTNTALPIVGGHEMVVDALARQFQALGHHVVVLAPRPAEFWRVRDRRFPYPIVRHPRFISTKHLVDWHRRALLRLHRRHRFDIVHTQGVYPVGYVAALCKERMRTPLVMTSQGSDANPQNHRFHNPMLRGRHVAALRAADALTAISDFIRGGYLFLDPTVEEKIAAMPNGVDVELLAAPVARPAAIDRDIEPGQYALFIGRLHPRKGVDVLLRAMALVPETERPRLLIAGDGGERAALRRLAGELRLEDRVRFLGVKLGAEKLWLLQNARFNVAPTRGWEGFGIVATEAFSAGRPLIASNVPGFNEVVRPDANGLLVPQESSEALAAALRRLFADDALVARLGAQARRDAQAYDWRAIARRHVALYEHVIRGHRQGRPFRAAEWAVAPRAA